MTGWFGLIISVSLIFVFIASSAVQKSKVYMVKVFGHTVVRSYNWGKGVMEDIENIIVKEQA